MNFVDTYQKYWKNGYVLTDLGLAGVDREVFRSLFNPVAEVFRKYPAGDCHLYTFGPGVPILGPELVVNGDGASLDGWTVAQDVGSVTVVGGALSLTKASAGTNTSVRQVLNTVAGKLYRLKYETKSSTGAYNVTCQTSAGYSTAVGSLGFDFVAASNGTALIVEQGTVGPATSVFDNIAVKEILGYSNTYSGFVAGNYFDSAGTTHASVDGSVGAVLDAAGSVGADLFSEFGVPVSGVTVDNGTRTASFSGSESTWSGVSLSVAPVANKTYRIKISVTLTSGKANLFGGGDAAISGDITASGTYTYHTKASTTGAFGIQSGGVVFNGTVRVDSIQEVTGIHASQSTPGFKPTLRKGIVNLLNNSNPSWTSVHGATGTCTITTGQPDPYGGNTAQRIAAVSNGDYALAQTSIGSSLTGVYTGGLMVKSATGSNQTFTIWTDNVASVAVTATQDWQIVAATQNVTANTLFKVMGGDIYVARIGLFAGTLTAAQILAAGGIPQTTTAPASSQAGVNYLALDGVDDWLSFSTPAFQFADDQATVVSASNRSIGTVANKIIYSPATENTGGIKRMAQISYDTTIQMVSASWYDGTNYDNLLFAWPIGVPFVAVAWKVGSTLKLRVNGVERASKAMTITSFTADRGTLGNYDPPQGVNAFHGEVYFASALKGTLTLADVQLLEKQAAAAAGIQL